MYLADFIQKLQELQDKHGGDTEVLLADFAPIVNPVYNTNAVVITDVGPVGDEPISKDKVATPTPEVDNI